MKWNVTLCGAVVVGAMIGAIAPMGCGKSEPIPPRAHYGEFGYLQGLDDDPIDTSLKRNEEIADEVHRVREELEFNQLSGLSH